MYKILDGKKLSQKILDGLKKEIKEKKLKLKLAVVLVGRDYSSRSYIKKKEEACDYVGIDFKLFRFSHDIEEKELMRKIRDINKDPENSGVIIQLPLPRRFNVQEILNLISLEKDIDGLSEKAIKGLIVSPTVKGIIRLLEEYSISLAGKNIVLVGKGKLVGRPLALWLERQGIDFSVVDRKIPDIFTQTLKADIIISGTGKPNLIKGDMVKKGAVVIDAGTSSESGKIKGDIDFETVSKKAGHISPVPGGVGPMTIACLLENLVEFNK